jgi:predicted Rossmann fold nucleotide-binding protein DprA/Smf involved in DNA uptake
MRKLHVVNISVNDNDYPGSLRERLGDDAPNSIGTVGNVELLEQHLLALL